MTAESRSSAIYEDVKRGLNILGYTGALLREDYEFVDVLSPILSVENIPLAAFSQDPPSYHNVCFGVTISNGKSGSELVSKYRSLGASQIFEIASDCLFRWKIHSESQPEYLGRIEPDNIINFFDKHKVDWSPDNFRLKALTKGNVSYQLDFVDAGLLPLIDREVKIKFDRLLTNTIKQSVERKPSIKQDTPKLFRLIFRLIAAKILADRKQYKGKWLQSDPKVVINEVEHFYFRHEHYEPVLDDHEIQNAIWDNIRHSFHFQNLSVDTLAYVYENTLMTPEIRQRTSTHGTPPEIAEYIVRHLPFESLEERERCVFEPFSGHAVFLVAALRRLRDLLPASMTTNERHSYFVDMLSGLEYEDFSREIARLSLMLADYPNPDGWHLFHGDVFDSILLARELLKSNIVLCNPPFEDFSLEEQKLYKYITSPHKPAEILNRVLIRPPIMLGFVLPRIFIKGDGYKNIRHSLLKTYSNIEILALPDNVFKYSEADTVLLIASGTKKERVWLTTGQVYEKDLQDFYLTNNPSYIKSRVLFPISKSFSGSIWISELNEIWDSLSELNTLNKYAQIHRGIEYNFSLRTPKENIYKAVSDHETPGFVKGLHLVSESLEPFLLRKYVYLNTKPADMRGESHKLEWNKRKVILNATRRSRGHWRLTAAIDNVGLYCTQYFHGIWVNDEIPLELITSILNSPIANAFVADFETSAKENNIDILNKIPIPDFDPSQTILIVDLVQTYQATRSNWIQGKISEYEGERICKKLIRSLDAEILKAYGLPKKLECRILNYFTGYKRSVPFPFNGYYPEGYQSRMKTLQDKINHVDLSKNGTVEERSEHQVNLMDSMRDARMRANTTRIKEE